MLINLMKFNSVWKTLPYVELIDVDKVEAHCSGISKWLYNKTYKSKITFYDRRILGTA